MGRGWWRLLAVGGGCAIEKKRWITRPNIVAERFVESFERVKSEMRIRFRVESERGVN